MVRLHRALCALTVFVLWFLVSDAVSAHDPFEITTRATVAADALTLEVTMAARTAPRLMPTKLPIDRALMPEDVAREEGSLTRGAALFYDVVSEGRRLAVRTAHVFALPENDLSIRLVYEPPSPGRLHVRARFLENFEDGYLNAFTLTELAPAVNHGLRVLVRDAPTLDARVLDAAPTGASRPRSLGAEGRRFFVLGARHLFTGYDHLLFLAALLFSTTSLRALLAITACFTVAHSVTLVLASRGTIALPDTVVEPLIAASIVFVALENLLPVRPALGRRLGLTFAFGLIHGLGFASVLGALTTPDESRWAGALRILSFNLGIEAGQLAFVLVAFPLLRQLGRSSDAQRWTARATSVLIALAGTYWFVERVFVLGR